MSWFEHNSVSFLGSIPGQHIDFQPISQMNGVKGTYFSRTLAQVRMLFFEPRRRGETCLVVGKKMKSKKNNQPRALK